MRRKMLGLLHMLNGVHCLSLTLALITSLRAQPSNGRTAASANLLICTVQFTISPVVSGWYLLLMATTWACKLGCAIPRFEIRGQGVKIPFRTSPKSPRDGHKRTTAGSSGWCNIRLNFTHIKGRAGLRAKWYSPHTHLISAAMSIT